MYNYGSWESQRDFTPHLDDASMRSRRVASHRVLHPPTTLTFTLYSIATSPVATDLVMPLKKRQKTDPKGEAAPAAGPPKKRAPKAGRLSALPSLPLDVLFEVSLTIPRRQYGYGSLKIPPRYLAILLPAILFNSRVPIRVSEACYYRDSRSPFGGRSSRLPKKMGTLRALPICLSLLGLH